MMEMLTWYALRDFTFEVALNRRVMMIRARHNDINDRYSLDFFTRSLEVLMTGQAVVSGSNLLEHFPKAYHPGGMLLVAGAEPTYDNLVSQASYLVYDATL